MEIKIQKGDGIYSVQVFTESVTGRPFPAWTVLVDIKANGKFLCNPNNPDLVELRRQILSQV